MSIFETIMMINLIYFVIFFNRLQEEIKGLRLCISLRVLQRKCWKINCVVKISKKSLNKKGISTCINCTKSLVLILESCKFKKKTPFPWLKWGFFGSKLNAMPHNFTSCWISLGKNLFQKPAWKQLMYNYVKLVILKFHYLFIKKMNFSFPRSDFPLLKFVFHILFSFAGSPSQANNSIYSWSEVNPLTPKIWLLILPSRCYTFPCKLVTRIWC